MIYFQQVFDNTLIKVLSKISIEIYKDFHKELSEEDIDKAIELYYTPSAIKKSLRNGRTYYVVNSNLTTIGHFSYERHGNKIFIHEIYLKEEYRNQKIGSQILRTIRDNFNEGLMVMVDKNNTNAIEFFKHHNFIETGNYRAEFLEDKSIECVIMDAKKNG